MNTGIYLITNVLTGHVYVGSTGKSFAHRWGIHKLHLRKGVHMNQRMQRAWDKYGPEIFHFGILEHCPRDLLESREEYWMCFFHSRDRNIGYNMCDHAGSRLGIEMPVGYKTETRDIYVYTKAGEPVGYYCNTSEAAFQLFGHKKYGSGIWAVLKGGRGKKSYRGLVFTSSHVFPGYGTDFMGGRPWSEERRTKRLELNKVKKAAGVGHRQRFNQKS